MFIHTIVSWIKRLAAQFNLPVTYGSELEAYIVSNNPQDSSDVDRLTREFDQRRAGSFIC